MIREIIANNPNAYEQYRTGKKATFGFFVGQVMKATKGQANPQLVNELLKSLLDSWERAYVRNEYFFTARNHWVL